MKNHQKFQLEQNEQEVDLNKDEEQVEPLIDDDFNQQQVNLNQVHQLNREEISTSSLENGYNLDYMRRASLSCDEDCSCQQNMPDLVKSTFGKCLNKLENENERIEMLRTIGQSLRSISLEFSRLSNTEDASFFAIRNDSSSFLSWIHCKDRSLVRWSFAGFFFLSLFIVKIHVSI